MRKYHQLLLLLLTAGSLSLLLVYRHEYNRLHYVLEVFNFFGQPCNLSELIESNSIANHQDWGPIPIFDLDDNIQIYSSFWMPNKEVKSIIIKSNKEKHARNCYLWFEDKTEPILGKFKYSKLQQDEGLEIWFYFCGSPILNTPYAVSYTKTKRKMRKHELTIDKQKIVFNTTVCLASSSEMMKGSFVDFISFHSLIGVDSFVIYSNDLPYRLIKIVSNLAVKLNIKITFYPWNFGENNLNKFIVEEDCLLRTMNQSKYVVALNVNEYIVPSTHYALKDVLANYNSKTDRFNLAVQKFCIEFNDPKIPIPLQNFKSVHDGGNKIRYIYKNSKEDNVISDQGIDSGLMSIHQYINCGNQVYKTFSDKTMLKYNTDFIRSTLVQLLLHKQL